MGRVVGRDLLVHPEAKSFQFPRRSYAWTRRVLYPSGCAKPSRDGQVGRVEQPSEDPFRRCCDRPLLVNLDHAISPALLVAIKRDRIYHPAPLKVMGEFESLIGAIRRG
jgi:hypothetical protein